MNRASEVPNHSPSDDSVHRTVLPGGLRVVTESVPTVRSATVGVWVGVGSRDEPAALSGASHFLEHLLFKGTTKRTALDISAEIEAVGGETNAYTSKEYTCFYARVLDSDVPLAIDVLGDVLCDSRLDSADVETERGVILEEIAMQRDEPGDDVHDIFAATLFGEHPLARDISGTPETIAALSRDEIFAFYKQRYIASHTVVTVAGNVDHDEVVAAVRTHFAPLMTAETAAASLRPETHRSGIPAQRLAVSTRDSEQAHLIVGCEGPARRDERRFGYEVLLNVLGGGMSSRLFQLIREEHGLAYSVFSYSTEYAETGLLGVYAGCNPEHAHQVLRFINLVLDEVARDGITDAELRRGKAMAKGSLVLSLEDTGARMTRLGRGEILFGNHLPVNEALARVEAVNVADVASLADDVLTRRRALAVAGPFDKEDFPGDLF